MLHYPLRRQSQMCIRDSLNMFREIELSLNVIHQVGIMCKMGNPGAHYELAIPDYS